MVSTRPSVDVMVAGAGIVGLATALAVKQSVAAPAAVVVRDAALAGLGTRPRSLRAVAIAAGTRRFLARLGVWDVIADGAQPMTDMVLTDTRVGAVPPPVFLSFAGEVAPGEPFAHMIVQDDLRVALLDACRRSGVELDPHGIADTSPGIHAMRIDPAQAGGQVARLLVAADGSRSMLRERAGLKTTGWDYGQTAIVATLAHDEDHSGRATQHFLPGGPLAILPMRAPDGTRRRVSIVWTERSAEAERLLALPDDGFLAELRARIGNGYGELRLEDRPGGHPLRVSLSRRLVAARLALVGDAARTIHPLAGQGLNLGLRDAEVLADLVVEALDLGLDPADPTLLARYEQSRRPDGALLAGTTDVLNRLFSNDSGPLRLLRDLGLSLVDRAPALKRRLIRQAAGAGLSRSS